MPINHKNSNKNLSVKERASRFRERKKLRDFGTELLKKAQTQPFEKRERKDIRILDAQIRIITNLPYCWNNEDMKKAWEHLRLIQRKLKLTDKTEQTIHLENLLHLIIDDSKANSQEQLQALSDTLAYAGRGMILEKEVETTNALVFAYFAQPGKIKAPSWLIPALIKMLMQRLTTDECLTLAKGLGMASVEIEEKLAALRPKHTGRNKFIDLPDGHDDENSIEL